MGIPAFLRKRSRRNAGPLATSDTYQARAALWALRLLVNAKGYRFFINKDGFKDADVLRLIGLESYSDEEVTLKDGLQLLKTRLSELEQKRHQPDLLDRNLIKLGQALGLTPVEQAVLAFLSIQEQIEGLADTLKLFSSNYGLPPNQQLVSLISITVLLPRRLIAQALSNESVLVRCRLLNPKGRGDELELLNAIDNVLMYEHQGPESLLRYFTQRGAVPELQPDDFIHIDSQYSQLKRYLKAAVRSGFTGTNILLYGPPGTGKTELVRTLVNALALELFEVKYARHDGEPMDGDDRFSAYLISQQILRASPQSVILFDEIEDVFTHREQNGQKAWINNMLEQNPRPVFWISNDINSMDKAYLRRFDMLICMPELNEATRLVMVQRTLQGLNVREEWMRRLAQKQGLQPAHLTRAAKVVRQLRLRKPERVEQTMEQLLSSLYQALGYQWEHKERRPSSSAFNPALSNTDFPLERLVSGLKRSGQARICLYGPPGTGKNELGRYLECVLEKPLLMRKASDLLGPYVGQTEQQLAAAFAEAKQTNAILMIDEADSFLGSRSAAQQQWEVSQVNELLVQMEEFSGILIMSTNFMDHFDSAALRRFDFKIRFNYLDFDQSWSFFNRLLGMHQSEPFAAVNVAGYETRLKRLPQLTPGDFATVERRTKVLAEPLTPETLMVGLEQEHAIKTRHQGRPIGFIS
jgi:SpoVK/Ycf46/Vps4 family AAA+-type ATPase